jgi:ATP-dependent DNA ligase
MASPISMRNIRASMITRCSSARSTRSRSNGNDVRALPLSMRKSNLHRLLRWRPDGIFVNPFEQGEIGPSYSERRVGWGLVSKRRDRPYRAGRSKHWVKVKNRRHPAMERVLEAFG